MLDEQLRQLHSRRAWKRARPRSRSATSALAAGCPVCSSAARRSGADVRAAAARSLGRLGAIEAIEPLVTASVARRLPRDVADLALLDIGPPRSTASLELARHADSGVRASAVDLLGLDRRRADIDPRRPTASLDPAASVRAAVGVGARPARRRRGAGRADRRARRSRARRAHGGGASARSDRRPRRGRAGPDRSDGLVRARPRRGRGDRADRPGSVCAWPRPSRTPGLISTRRPIVAAL